MDANDIVRDSTAAKMARNGVGAFSATLRPRLVGILGNRPLLRFPLRDRHHDLTHGDGYGGIKYHSIRPCLCRNTTQKVNLAPSSTVREIAPGPVPVIFPNVLLPIVVFGAP